jgi:hypothetical protein
MLLEQVVDSVLRRYGIGQHKEEEEGRAIIRRLHELLDDPHASARNARAEDGRRNAVPVQHTGIASR